MMLCTRTFVYTKVWDGGKEVNGYRHHVFRRLAELIVFFLPNNVCNRHRSVVHTVHVECPNVLEGLYGQIHGQLAGGVQQQGQEGGQLAAPQYLHLQDHVLQPRSDIREK